MAEQRVSTELHDAVLRRDGRCFLARLDPAHICRDTWGRPHASTELCKLTVDHVHLQPGGVRGKRAPSDTGHLVAICAKGNIDGPSRTVRQAERAYLQELLVAEVGNELSLDEHLLHCELCASGEDACETGLALGTLEFLVDQEAGEMSSGRPLDIAQTESLAAHRRLMHDPRDPEAEPCCVLCHPDCPDGEVGL